MGRKFRIFSNKDVMNSSELSKKRASTEILKYAHNKCFGKKDINFKINCNTLEFTNFKDYSTFISLVKIFRQYNQKSNTCLCNPTESFPHAYGLCLSNNYCLPETISDGLKSQVYGDELITYAKKCSANNNCEEYFEKIFNTQVSDNPHLSNHGHVFKVNIHDPNISHQTKIKLGTYLTTSEENNTYNCNTYLRDRVCSVYDVVYPSQYQFLNYTTNTHPRHADKIDTLCIEASKQHIKSFSVFPRHNTCKYEDDVIPYIQYEYEKDNLAPKITGCGINSRMHELLLLKEKQSTCCHFNSY